MKVPVGVAGPLRVNGLFAQGDYYVPLATTEAALVASYSRGSQVISACGGCTAMLLNEGKTLTYDLIGDKQASHCSVVGRAVEEKLRALAK